MKLCNLKIGTRLLIGFGLVILFSGLVTIITSLSLLSIEKNSKHIKSESIPFAILADEMVVDSVQVQQFLTDVGATREPDAFKDAEAAAVRFRSGIARFREMYQREGNTGQLKKLEEMERQFAAFYNQGDRMAKAYISEGTEGGNRIMRDFDAASLALAEKVKSFRREQTEEATNAATEMVDMSARLKLLLFALAALSLTTGVLIAWATARSITRPLTRAVTAIGRIADGDLTEQMECSSRDELGTLACAINKMVDNLNGVLAVAITISHNLTSGAEKLSSTSQQISTGAQELSSQTTTAAAASEEMAATSGEIARNCLTAADHSTSASRTARDSSAAIKKTVNGMFHISEVVHESAAKIGKLDTRSQQIGEIISTIEDIADQTNLLALNASIEAARAGEQGRGFAVVADEVRALAERTAKATRDISSLIRTIQEEIIGAIKSMETGTTEVAAGTRDAEESGQALAQILETIEAIAAQLSQISAAAEQQTSTTCELSSNIQQVAQVVEITAKGAHDSADSASDLAAMAEELRQVVGRFKVAA